MVKLSKLRIDTLTMTVDLTDLLFSEAVEDSLAEGTMANETLS